MMGEMDSMDNQRLNTTQVLAAGVMDRPIPKTEVPFDRERVEICDDDQGMISRKGLSRALESGRLLECCEYYGIAYAWKEGEVYRGTLLQYRLVSEAPSFDSAQPLLDWLEDIVPAIVG
jgi:hypothetical protein